MLKALVRQGVVHSCVCTELGPNGSIFSTPKSKEKARLIWPRVPFNTEPRELRGRVELPLVEIVALIMFLEICDTHATFPPCLRRSESASFDILGKFANLSRRNTHAELVRAHIDMSNCFWGFVFPQKHWSTFRVLGDGEFLVFLSMDGLTTNFLPGGVRKHRAGSGGGGRYAVDLTPPPPLLSRTEIRSGTYDNILDRENNIAHSSLPPKHNPQKKAKHSGKWGCQAKRAIILLPRRWPLTTGVLLPWHVR